MRKKALLKQRSTELPRIGLRDLPALAMIDSVRLWKRRNIQTRHKTTTKLGKREYMQKYMKQRRKEGKQLGKP